eukprot:135344-Hanusia_phi.AAC.1
MSNQVQTLCTGQYRFKEKLACNDEQHVNEEGDREAMFSEVPLPCNVFLRNHAFVCKMLVIVRPSKQLWQTYIRAVG